MWVFDEAGNRQEIERRNKITASEGSGLTEERSLAQLNLQVHQR
jgi:hypothetical protein